MNTYKINYNQLRQQPEISGMLTALERGLAKFKVDFYLVGAVARDVWMNAINKIDLKHLATRVMRREMKIHTQSMKAFL